MVVLIHVIIAISSIIYTTLLAFSPSKNKFKVTYALVGSTIASGTYLVISMPAHMTSVCETGLFYIGGMLVAIIYARKKLARQSITSNENRLVKD